MSYHLHETYDPTAIDYFRTLKGKAGPFEKGLFIAEGPKVTRKIIESDYEIPSAFMTPQHFESLRSELERRPDTTEVYLASKPDMETVVGYSLHQGIMITGRIPANHSILLTAPTWQSPFLVVALDGLADAENMGAIIRNAAAFGASAVIVDDQSCDPYLRRSVRVSMGMIVDVDILRVPDLARALREIRAIHPCTIIGAELSESSVDLRTLDHGRNVVLVFGSEGSGLRQSAIESCDVLAQIPMPHAVDSLNVAVASGIFLYQCRKHIG